MGRHPARRGARAIEERARDLLLRDVLPRWLRLACDPDAEASALLSSIERRLAGHRDPLAASDHEAAEIRHVIRRIVDLAQHEERQRRLATLGTDGTP